MKIALIGFMGSGKSSVGERLSQQLSLPCIEMDALVLQRTSCQTMHEVFQKGGELLLRVTEIEIAKEYASQDNWILSTGGGVVLNKVILDCLQAKTVFLYAKLETILKRLEKDHSRPLLPNAKRLYEFRQPLYREYADLVIETDDRSIEEIVAEIKERYGL